MNNTMNRFTHLTRGVVVAVLFVAFGVTAMPTASEAAPAPTCVFNTIIQPDNNGGTTLSWKATNARSVHITTLGIVGDADSTVVYPNQLTVYTLTAVGDAGSTTCTAVAHPVSSYPHLTQPWLYNTNHTYDEQCSLSVSPDYVTQGGTAVLSWKALNADRVWIDHGIGTVSREGSRIVPASTVPETYTMTAEWGNGTIRTCSADVVPTSYMHTYAPYNYTSPYMNTGYGYGPQATYNTVSLSQVPYTGTNDAAYVSVLIATLLASVVGAWMLYTRMRYSA